MKYKRTPKLGFKVYQMKNSCTCFWSFILLLSLSIFLYFFLEFYILKFKYKETYIPDFSYLQTLFIKILRNSFLISLFLIITILTMVDLTKEYINLIRWGKRKYRTLLLNR